MPEYNNTLTKTPGQSTSLDQKSADELAPKKKEYPELSAKPVDRTTIIIAVVVAVVIFAALIGSGVYLFLHPEVASVLRDIVIVFFGLAVVVIIVLLMVLTAVTVYLALKVNDLVKLLDREIKPILSNLQNTMVDVRGTATFINDKAVQPVITTASAFSATKSVFRTLFQKK
jgi:hypothetical protein